MKISRNTAAGKHLLGEAHDAHDAHEWGVDPEDLHKAYITRFDLQSGGAITLPVPLLGAIIFIKSKHLEFDGHELRDSSTLALLRHEMCHVNQIRRWGTVLYILRHLWARIQTFSVLAKDSSVEVGCYEVQRLFRDKTFTPN